MLTLVNHKLKLRSPGEKQQPQICRVNHSNGRKQRGTKEPLDEGERREWKVWLKTQHSKNKDHGIQVPSLQGKDGEIMETMTDFIFFGSKITWTVTATM